MSAEHLANGLLQSAGTVAGYGAHDGGAALLLGDQEHARFADRLGDAETVEVEDDRNGAGRTR